MCDLRAGTSWRDMTEAAIEETPESAEEMIALQNDEIDPAVCDLSQYES